MATVVLIYAFIALVIFTAWWGSKYERVSPLSEDSIDAARR